MRLFVLCFFALSVGLLTGCDKETGGFSFTSATPTPTPVPTPSGPTPTPKKSGDWMFDKNRGNPLEQKARK
jgi:hypothetical protein